MSEASQQRPRNPASMREALLEELFGDVLEALETAQKSKLELESVVDRIELLNKAIPGISENLAQQMQKESDKFREGFKTDSKEVEKALESILKEIQESSAVVDKSSKKFALLALVTGFSGGLIGALILGFAIANKVFI